MTRSQSQANAALAGPRAEARPRRMGDGTSRAISADAPRISSAKHPLLRLRPQQVPLLLVAFVVTVNAWMLRATTDSVAYLDDASIHEQMVRFASRSVAMGAWPGSRWFPFLNLGSPQFLHYQGLAATTVGALGSLGSPDTAFRWSLYLLLVLWPIAIYWSGRIMGLPTAAAAFAAALSPFLASTSAVGFEQGAYLWIGYGLWAQLCASWLLPFARAWTWRAMDDRRAVFKAVLFVTLTAAVHFETGYLAFLAVVLLPWMRGSELRQRLTRAGGVLLGSACATAVVTVPLLANSSYAALNTYLSTTGLVRGYGAKQDLWWLITGSLFDHRRLPVISLLVLVGAASVLWRWRSGLLRLWFPSDL